ncbi:ABC transporter substrate-binding protein [Neorhizobium alkalisoli]|uniref:ABC transporter substrate-binding protein n=1 Tax=Neorhizobium alkalisoli TaxID=528178 RepID=UPI000CF8E023|nr:ABC transporter substrate-binding protein [Neorhizobium alkalisoli]
MQTTRRTFLGLAAAAAALPTTFSIAKAQSKPEVIRIAGPGNAAGKPYGTGPVGVLRARQFLEKEFSNDGIRIDWQFPRGTGPAINEAFANGQLDFSSYGGLPNIVGRGAGLKTRVLAGNGNAPTYLVVRPSAQVGKLADLKGKKVAVQRGTIYELSLSQFLGEVGLTSGDVQIFDLQGADQTAAFSSGDVDAVIGGGSNVLHLVEKGLGQVVFTTKSNPAPGSSFGSFVVIERFSKQYPEITQRVVKSFIEAAHFASLEENRETLYDLLALTGAPRSAFVADYKDDDLRDRNNPLVDDFYKANLEAGIRFSTDQKLIRKPFDVSAWIDDRYLKKALADLGYNGFWASRDAKGKKIS